MENQRVILIGRHNSGDIEGVTIVAQENIVWSLNRDECVEALKALNTRAEAIGAKPLFQNIPAILSTALAVYPITYGVMISVPDVSARQAPTVRRQIFETQADADQAYELVKLANGRAIVKRGMDENGWDFVEIEVEAITPFRLDHIEWVTVPALGL